MPNLPPLIVVEFDLYNSITDMIQVLGVCKIGPFMRTVDGVRRQYEPGLYLPILLGSRISAESYGQALRIIPNGGVIEFVLCDSVIPYLDYHWSGHEFRVFEGNEGDEYENLILVYKGRIMGMGYDRGKVSVSTSDAGLDLDKPLVIELYDDDEVLESLRGKPKPRLWGKRFNINPVMEDEASQLYRISSHALDEIEEIRVGGVPWDMVESAPEPGQWMADLAGGTFTLGGTPLGGEIRCDAKAVGWESLTTGALLTEIVEEAGGAVDADAILILNTYAPYLIGYYTSLNPINRQDVLDRIMNGVVGWWGVTALGYVTGGVITPPDSNIMAEFDDVTIMSLRMVQKIPPAWRIQVEHSGNENPSSQFYSSVTETNQQKWRAEGIIAPKFDDGETGPIKTEAPHAVDLPVIHSLVNNEVDAIAIRDRAVACWTVGRDVYDVIVYDADDLILYNTVTADYSPVSGSFRIHSWIPSIGGGPTQMQIWG